MFTIFDSNFLLHRILNLPAFFELEFNNVSTGGAFGVITSLQKTLAAAPKGNMNIAVWDGFHSKRRKMVYPEYKANRKPKTEEDKLAKELYFSKFAPQQAMLKDEIFPALGICNIHLEDREGDDVLYQVCNLLKSEDTLLITEDKDMLQLIHHFPKLRIFRPIATEHVGIGNFERVTGIHPSLYLYFKAMLGDDSDGITGIAGVGEKTVKQIISQLKPDTTPVELMSTLKSLYDADVEKSPKSKKTGEVKLKISRLGKVYSGWGVISRNLELCDISREEFSNMELERIKNLIATNDYSIHKDSFYCSCQRLGFNKILADFDNFISAFDKF